MSLRALTLICLCSVGCADGARQLLPSSPSPITTPIGLALTFHPRPFTGDTIDWNLRTIGNPSLEPIVVVFSWSNVGCTESYGRPQVVRVESLRLGTFEPPPVPCDTTLVVQGHADYGTTPRNCDQPDHSSQQLFTLVGDSCNAPPPETPVCVGDLWWGDWMDINAGRPHTPAPMCKRIRYQYDCNWRIVGQQVEACSL